MRKVGPAPSFDVYEGGLGESDESQGDFAQALTEVRAVSGALEVCYGPGEASVTALPDLPPRPEHAGLVDTAPPADLGPPIDTEVEAYLVGLDLPPPRPTRRRAASLLEQGKSTGEQPEKSQAERKA